MSHFSIKPVLTLLILISIGMTVRAENTGPTTAQSQPTSQPAAATRPSADEVHARMLQQLRPNPMVQPTPPGQVGEAGSGSGRLPYNSPPPTTRGHEANGGGLIPAATHDPDSGLVPPLATSVDIDLDLLGIAPGDNEPTLHREGQFIVNRRGHLVRAPSTGRLLFVFASETDQTTETPMVLIPCQTLQNMEELIYERGQNIVFILSGQVLLYRGVNYLLPTMMKLAIDGGNLRP